MLRRSNIQRWGYAPSVYPFRKPFYDTPYDEDRHAMHHSKTKQKRRPYPAWMDHGIDGTGSGIGLYRAHPLSKHHGILADNLQRDTEHVPRVFKAMTQGFAHESGQKRYSTGSKLPQPQMHPYLTGEPCPVYGWRILDHNVPRNFDAPQVPLEKVRYKPYVALHERRIIGEDGSSSTAKISAKGEDKSVATKSSSSEGKGGKDTKPLLKRLFFWQ